MHNPESIKAIESLHNKQKSVAEHFKHPTWQASQTPIDELK
jgi:hypothetical protein